MKKQTYSTFSYNDGEAVLAFDRGLNIARVELRLHAHSTGNVCVRYAQNGVLDVLIPLGSRRADEMQVYELKTPICATHLFVSTDTDVTLDEIVVYEAEKTDGIAYPHAFDTDLSALYRLSCVRICFDAACEVRYSVYLSADGIHFSLLEDGAFDGTERAIAAEGCEARFVRVLVIYCAETVGAPVPIVTFEGEKIGEGALPAPVAVSDFKDTPYAQPITEEELLSNVYGIVERRLGASYQDWFCFVLAAQKDCDYFILSDQAGRIRIEGNCGVSLAAGLNHYLKYYCKVHISEVGDQVRMPDAPIPIGRTLRKENRARVRFAHNVCAHSYTMPFWGEEEWQRELDFLALSGVNLVMDLTAVEEVWRRFLSWIGYSHAEMKELISGPAYYAWQWIGNQMGQGAPLPDGWFAYRTELARKNHRFMRSLGMEFVLPGYSGMVPTNVEEYDSDVSVISQGSWCAFQKASMLHPDHPSFDRYADCYYEILQKVFGKSRHFTDSLFHEGGNKKGLSERMLAKRTLDRMKRVHPDAVWVITSWQGNPSSELLAGIGEEDKKHALILDLYAEKLPNYGKGNEGNKHYGYAPEFDGTPWIYCMLNNFGGRLGLHGHLDNLVSGIPSALNQTEHCAGIGMTPEASENNPVLYDFLFDSVWQDENDDELPKKDLRAWLQSYAERRYGVKSSAAEEAWEILADTVYKAELNMKGQGAPESVTNARPALSVKAASAWGNAVIDYDKQKLHRAYDLLLSIYEEAKGSEGYLYDLASVHLQVLANQAQDVHTAMADAFQAKELSAFDRESARFLSLILSMDKAAAVSPYFSLDRWTGMAEKLAEKTGADDLTCRIFLFNARALITTWGAYRPSEQGLLHDYSNRTWAGLLGTLYYDRWARWIGARRKELMGEPPEKEDFFRMEWFFTWGLS